MSDCSWELLVCKGWRFGVVCGCLKNVECFVGMRLRHTGELFMNSVASLHFPCLLHVFLTREAPPGVSD